MVAKPNKIELFRLRPPNLVVCWVGIIPQWEAQKMALFTVDEILDVARGPNYLILGFTEEVQNLLSPLSFEIQAGFLNP